MMQEKPGRKKKRDSVIGILHGNKKALTGIVDFAMVGQTQRINWLRAEKNTNKIMIQQWNS